MVLALSFAPVADVHDSHSLPITTDATEAAFASWSVIELFRELVKVEDALRHCDAASSEASVSLRLLETRAETLVRELRSRRTA